MSSSAYRYLRGYTLDPGFSTRLDTMHINVATYRLPWENVEAGPIGEYIEVIDYDPASNCFYQPIQLNRTDVLAQNGLTPSEGNPQFHQQFVYSVAMKTIGHFETALGRKLIWKHRRQQNPDEEYVQRLRIYPHATRDANAYYDPEKMALCFGYFAAAERIQGGNFPGGVVFTCLSPDIVAHETTHALLDAVHERFTENTNVDVPAFHEAFADIVALLQRFTFRELVEHQLFHTKGRLDEFNLLGELATQFGEALKTGRGALRGAIGAYNPKTKKWEKFQPDPHKYQEIDDPHQRGAILVATIFDSFLRLYHFRTADLIRIATNGTGQMQEGNISIDLVKRLAKEASDIADHLLEICIRALDYCTPLDITFGNYLRALITADLDIAPEDESGYRVALIEAFRAWGIFPDRVNTFSAESLRWDRAQLDDHEQQVMRYIAEWLRPKIQELIDETDRFEIYKKTWRMQAAFHNYLHDKKKPNFDPEYWEAFLIKLGLTSRPFQLVYQGKTYQVKPPPIEVHKIRPIFRFGREGKRIDQVIISLSQTVRETVNDNPVIFRGGSTLILNLSNLKDAEYLITKNVTSSRRFAKQLDYQLGEASNSFAYAGSTYEEEGNSELNFKKLHFTHDH